MNSIQSTNMNSSHTAPEITGYHFGDRGKRFQDMVTDILKSALSKNFSKKFLSKENKNKVWDLYGQVFTSESVDPRNNYQVWEILGDGCINKFITVYMTKRFPALMCPEGVKILARLKINYGSKKCFAEIARKLGFWEFISASNDLRQRKMKSLLEDVLEAFFGVTEYLIDLHANEGVNDDKDKFVGPGYSVVAKILTQIFDTMDISLEWTELFDSKTIVKEIFDKYPVLGILRYEEQRTESPVGMSSKSLKISNLYGVIENKKELLGTGKAALKCDAQQNASKVALKYLASKGYVKEIHPDYKKLGITSKLGVEIKEPDITPEDVKNEFKKNINDLYPANIKIKYGNAKYEWTPLHKYCRGRNLSGIKSCLMLGSDLNVNDTNAMFPLDFLFIGQVDEDCIEKILKLLLKECKEFKMTKNVFDMYCKNKYIGEFYSDVFSKFELVD